MSDPDGFYKILGVTPGSSLDVIKKAYCKLMKQYNPDMGTLARQAKNTITDQNELKNKIKELSDFCCKINEAKEYLSDSEKKERYDQGIGKDGPSFGNGGSVFDIFSSMFGSNRGRRVKKVEDTLFNIKISLKESFTGKTSKFKVNRKIVCRRCDGKGGDEIIVCSKCGGKGTKKTIQRMGNTILQRNVECNDCRGEGQIIKGNKCGECDGKKMKNDEQIVSVKLREGIKNKEVIKYDKMGDEAIGFVTGDLIFIVNVNDTQKHNEYNLKRISDDLIADFKINLFEALDGTFIEFNTLDDRRIIIQVPKVEQLDKCIIVNNEGFKSDYSRGNLVLKPEYIIPKNIDLSKVKNLLGIKSKTYQDFKNKTKEDIKEGIFGEMTEEQEVHEESEEHTNVRFSDFGFF